MIIIRLRPIRKAVLSLIFNRNFVVNFKSNYNKLNNIILNRYNIYILYLLLKVERYNVNINKILPDRVNLKFYNHIFEIPKSPDILNMIIDFFEILRQGKISIILIEENNIMVNIKNLDLTLKAPLSLLAPAISVMLSKKYYKTWYWDVDVWDKVVVDVGAYIGESALFFASRGARIVYAYEPSKELYEIAMENCSKYNNIILHNFGLGSSEKYASLTGFGIGFSVNERAQSGEKVLLKSFNEELKKIIRKEGKIDVLKLNCEGCEWQFLNCLDQELTKHIQTIIVEIHGKNHNAFLKKMKKYGFELIKKRKLFGYRDIANYTLQKTY